jgi:hypothetical protein
VSTTMERACRASACGEIVEAKVVEVSGEIPPNKKDSSNGTWSDGDFQSEIYMSHRERRYADSGHSQWN